MSSFFAELFSSRALSIPSCGIYHSRNGGCKPGLVYVARSGDLYKIGFSALGCSTKTLDGRLRAVSTQLGIAFEFEHGLFANCGRGLEKHLHRRFWRCRFDVQYEKGKHKKPYEIFRLSVQDFSWILDLSAFNGSGVTHLNSVSDVQKYLSNGRIV